MSDTTLSSASARVRGLCSLEGRYRVLHLTWMAFFMDSDDRFYARYGFEKIADIDFCVGSHRDDEFLLELRLETASM